jgi:hypothetical protein
MYVSAPAVGVGGAAVACTVPLALRDFLFPGTYLLGVAGVLWFSWGGPCLRSPHCP